MLRKLFKLFMILISMVFALYITIIIYIGSSFENHFDDLEFDPKVWKKYYKNMDVNSLRGKMYEDLILNYLKKNMLKEDVIKLLGKPDEINKDKEFSYNLGMWSGLRIDYDSLNIKFDRNNRVIKFIVYNIKVLLYLLELGKFLL